MGKYIIEDTTLDKIASAVRSRSGKTEKWTVPNGLVSAIMSIPTQTNVVQNVTGKLQYAEIYMSSSNNQIDISNYVKDDNFTLAFAIYDGSKWKKRAIAPSLKNVGANYPYAYSETTNGDGLSAGLQAYWGGHIGDNYGLSYNNGILTCDSAYKFARHSVLIYVGKEE